MKLLFAVVLAGFLFIIGCGDSTQPPADDLANSLKVTHKTNPTLVGGGRRFRPTDTITWYDIDFSLLLENTGGKVRYLTTKVELGLFNNNKFIRGNGWVLYAGDSISSNHSSLIKAHGTEDHFFNIQNVGMGRRDDDWMLPYGYRVTIYDQINNDSLVLEGAFEGSTPDNRFKGIVYTTEFSPDPITVFDGPDDNDWKMTAPTGAAIEPCFPNPTNGINPSTILRFDISQKNDSAFYTINTTPSYSILTEKIGKLETGKYEVNIEMKDRPLGTYRLYYHLFRDGQEYITHGDIMITN